uniref:Uncharacterized protein n=1 Tax=Arundo donax TaxID=35708 RepID=A0A0A9D467_ARUDO
MMALCYFLVSELLFHELVIKSTIFLCKHVGFFGLSIWHMDKLICRKSGDRVYIQTILVVEMVSSTIAEVALLRCYSYPFLFCFGEEYTIT